MTQTPSTAMASPSVTPLNTAGPSSSSGDAATGFTARLLWLGNAAADVTSAAFVAAIVTSGASGSASGLPRPSSPFLLATPAEAPMAPTQEGGFIHDGSLAGRRQPFHAAGAISVYGRAGHG